MEINIKFVIITTPQNWINLENKPIRLVNKNLNISKLRIATECDRFLSTFLYTWNLARSISRPITPIEIDKKSMEINRPFINWPIYSECISKIGNENGPSRK